MYQVSSDKDGWLYAAAQCGLFRSTDGGKYWEGLSIPYPSTWINAVTCDTSGAVYALYQNGNYILRSHDRGQSWTSIGSAPASCILVLADGTIFAGAYRSIDEGASWSTTAEEAMRHDTRDIVVTPRGILFAAAGSAGVYRSSDSGGSWVNVSDSNLTGLAVGKLVVLSDREIYAGCSGGVYGTTDSGDHWQRLSAGLADGRSVTALTSNADGTLIAGEYGMVFVSTDKGRTWDVKSADLPLTNIYSLRVTSSGAIYAGLNGAGIFSSSDEGKSWHECNDGLTCVWIWSLGASKGGNVLAGSNTGMLYHSTDSGISWRNITQDLKGLSGNSPHPFTMNPDGMGYLTSYGRVFSTHDGGESWELRNADIAGFSMTTLAINSKGIPYAGGLIGLEYGAFKSSDTGRSWKRLTDSSIYAIDYIYVDGWDRIFGIRYQDGLFGSDDEGYTWHHLYGWGKDWGNCFIENDSGQMFMGTNKSGVITSFDGRNWYRSAEGLPGGSPDDPYYRQSVKSMAVNARGDLFAAPVSNVYYSRNNGHLWHLADSTVQIREAVLATDPEGYLYAGTALGSRRGVYRSRVSTILLGVGDDLLPPKVYSLDQNYPNPFNPTTHIGYRIADLGFVSLKIYNTLGQQVATLVNDVKPPGSYTVTWNAGNIPSGVYFYKLSATRTSGRQSGGYVEVKKMLLIR